MKKQSPLRENLKKELRFGPERSHWAPAVGSPSSGSGFTDLLSDQRRVDPVVQAGLVGHPQNLLEPVLGDVIEAGLQDKVADVSVLLVAMATETDQLIDVVACSEVLHILKNQHSRWSVPRTSSSTQSQ